MQNTNDSIRQNFIPEPQQTPQSTSKGKISYWALSTLILLFCLLGSGLYILSTLKNSAQDSPTLSTNTLPLQSQTPQANNEISTKLSLSDTLVQFCINNKVPVNKIPVKLSKKIIADYQITDELPCSSFPNGYLTFASPIDPSQTYTQYKEINIFSFNSIPEGQGANLDPAYQYSEVHIDGKTYYLIFGQGDNGSHITNHQITLDLIAQKTGNSDVIIRSKISTGIKNPKALELVKKYGSSDVSTDEGPGTIAIDGRSAQKLQFVTDFIALIPQMPEVQEMAKDAQADLDEISF